MKKGSVLVITLGVIVVLFLISIFVISIVQHKLKSYEVLQKQLLTYNMARSSGYALFDLLTKKPNFENYFTTISTRVYFDLPDFKGTSYCELSEIQGMSATVTCTAELDGIKNSQKLKFKRYLMTFALAVDNFFEVGNNTTIYGDILISEKAYEEASDVINNITFVNGTYYITDKIGETIQSTPGDFPSQGSIIIGDNESTTITSQGTVVHYDEISIGNRGQLIFDTTPNKDIILVVDKLSLTDSNKENVILKGDGNVIIWINESVDSAKNKLWIGRANDSEARILFFGTSPYLNLELKNKGSLSNVYVIFPNGSLSAVNSLVLEGSFLLKDFVAKNNSDITFIPPQTDFIYLSNIVDPQGRKFKFLGWSP